MPAFSLISRPSEAIASTVPALRVAASSKAVESISALLGRLLQGVKT